MAGGYMTVQTQEEFDKWVAKQTPAAAGGAASNKSARVPWDALKAMNPAARRFPWTIGIGLLLLILSLSLAFLARKSANPGRPSREPLPVIAQIADFSLTNENNAAVSLADLRGRVWIARYHFHSLPADLACE